MSFVRTSLECVANYRAPFTSPEGEKSFEEVETLGLFGKSQVIAGALPGPLGVYQGHVDRPLRKV